MNRRQRFVVFAGMALIFWFGFVSSSEHYARYLSATLALTMGGLLLLHGRPGTPGRWRRVAVTAYHSPRVRLILAVALIAAGVGLGRRALLVGFANAPTASVLYRDVEHRFIPGEAFADILVQSGVSEENAAVWIKAAGRIYPLSQIHDGQTLSMRVDVGASDLVSMKMDLDVATNLVAHRKDGQVVAEREAVAMGKVRRVVEGTIESSFYASAARADVPDEIISETAEVLGWDLDFEKLRPGSRFSIQFEELRNPDGVGTVPGQLLSVKIVEAGNGKVHEGIWYQQLGETKGAYYNSKGQALGPVMPRSLTGESANRFAAMARKIEAAYAAARRAGGSLVLGFGTKVNESSPTAAPAPHSRATRGEPSALTFHGSPCTVDCSGHEAGYQWAEENGIDDPDDCEGDSDSFIEGCQAYAEQQSSPSTTN